MTGGNQLKLSVVVCGTPFGDAIVAAHERGAVVAGTSAGASIQSSHMVAFGVGGATPKQRMTQVAAGLGLLESTVIDQHFDQRNRYGRLLMIVAQSPAAARHRRRRGHRGRRRATSTATRCCGSSGAGAVTIFDPAADRHQRLRGQALRAAAGQRRGAARAARGRAFDLTTRTLVPPRAGASTPRRPPSSPRPAATCASWPATSPPATPRPPALRRRLARTRRAERPPSTRHRHRTRTETTA